MRTKSMLINVFGKTENMFLRKFSFVTGPKSGMFAPILVNIFVGGLFVLTSFYVRFIISY